MKSIAATQSADRSDVDQARRADTSPVTWGARLAVWWLRLLFICARQVPWLVRLLRQPTMWLAPRFSSSIRRGTHANARRIFVGRELTTRELIRFSEQVVGRFCDFVLEVAQGGSSTSSQLRARIESVEGRDRYLARRRGGGGAVVVTAHMGSFEVGLAALAEVEPGIHVVFKRDEFEGFESLRSGLRRMLGIREAAIDDGWTTWLGLRDALRANDVIVLQGDRAMPGQKSQLVRFLGGHLRLPVGPAKLAAACGSPIIPVFTIMTDNGGCSIFIEEPIEVSPEDPASALTQLASSIEKFVARHPDQWLMLHPAFAEDEPAARSL